MEVETDPGFPSGPWVGYWIYARFPQRGFRQMTMDLTFEGGRLRGSGSDEVGPFFIAGTYDRETRECWWTKTYPGSHSVSYRGHQSGKTIQGRWVVTMTHVGTFSIWPGGEGALTNEFFLTEQKAAVLELAGVAVP